MKRIRIRPRNYWLEGLPDWYKRTTLPHVARWRHYLLLAYGRRRGRQIYLTS